MGLMSFLDLGFGQGIIKFVSYYEAKNDFKKINDIISVSLLVYVVMGMLGFILIYSLADFLAGDVFKVSPKYIVTASHTFKLVAFGFMINFVNGVFSNIPKALQRYDISVKIQNAIWFSVSMATVGLLYYGKGLVEVITAWLVVQSVGLLIYYFFSRRILPTLKITVRFDRAVFQEIFGFSFFTAVNSVTGNVVVRVDKMIIGGFLGTSAVAYYNIAFMIAQMGAGFVGAVTQHLFPSVSALQALGDKGRLVALFKKAFRYVTGLSVIIAAELVFLGDDFISLWMGKEFASQCYGILPILSMVYFFSAASVIAVWFYTGLGYSRINLLSSSVGAVSYLLGAFFLVPRFGSYGAALSFALILVPFPLYTYYLLKLIGIDIKWYLGLILKATTIVGCAFAARSVFPFGIATVPNLIISSLLLGSLLVILLFMLRIFSDSSLLSLKIKLREITGYGEKI